MCIRDRCRVYEESNLDHILPQNIDRRKPTTCFGLPEVKLGASLKGLKQVIQILSMSIHCQKQLWRDVYKRQGFCSVDVSTCTPKFRKTLGSCVQKLSCDIPKQTLDRQIGRVKTDNSLRSFDKHLYKVSSV